MDNKINKLSAGAVLFLWLLWLLSVIGQTLFSAIPDRLYEQLGFLLGYKLLLIICTFLLLVALSLLILYFSKHVKRENPVLTQATKNVHVPLPKVDGPPSKDEIVWIPFKKLLWKGRLQTGICEDIPYCPDHKLQLYYQYRFGYSCPTCGSDKFTWLDLKERQAACEGANSLLQGIKDKTFNLKSTT
jgi:uncharacterized membrane protein